jgi:hypothetical protein
MLFILFRAGFARADPSTPPRENASRLSGDGGQGYSDGDQRNRVERFLKGATKRGGSVVSRFHCTAIVTWLLDLARQLRRTGTAVPGSTPFGTRTFTWL